MKKNEFIDLTIEGIIGGIKWGLAMGLAYLIAFSLLSAHITTLAESVCPLMK